MGRIGQAICRPRRPRPIFHSTATTAPFGAATAAGVILGLPEERLAHALNLAATGAAGLREVFISGTEAKPLQVGRGTQTGVAAALLSAAGFDGPTMSLEGEFGFIKALGGTQPDASLITQDLGSRFAVSETTFKIHSTCGMLFTPIDAAIALRSRLDLEPERIEHVQVALAAWAESDSIFGRRRPATPGIARFSVPFAVAAAFKDGEVGTRQISEAGIHDSVIAELEDRVELVFDDAEVEDIHQNTKDDDYFFHPSAVTVRVGGEEFRQLERTPRGYDPQRALTEDEMIRKFRAAAQGLLGDHAKDAVVETVMALDEQDDLRELSRLLSAGASAR
jgi:2-methylcitrate dehydratase PrpD